MRWILKSEQGFTLIETLISLFVSAFVLLLLTGGILQIVAVRDTLISNAQESRRANSITGDRQVEWHIFLNQLENYLQDTYEPVIGQNEFEVKEPTNTDRGNRVVFYRRDATNKTNFSRRTINGNHRMLTGVNNIAFNQSGGWLLIEVFFMNGDQYTGHIFIDSWIEKEKFEKELTEDEPETEVLTEEAEENEELAIEEEDTKDEAEREEIEDAAVEEKEKSDEE